MQSKSFTLSIPTKPYIKQWLVTQYQYGLSLAAPHPAIIAIKALLKGKSHSKKNDIIKNFDRQDYTDSLTISLPFNLVKTYKIGIYLSNIDIVNINTLLEAIFNESLYFHISEIYTTLNTQQSIERFCEKYKIVIDQHVTYEALKKSQYRFSIKLKKANWLIDKPVL